MTFRPFTIFLSVSMIVATALVDVVNFVEGFRLRAISRI